MMTLYLGSVETTQGIATSRKVTLTAHTLADLSSQYTAITIGYVEHPQCRFRDHGPYPGERSQGRRVGALDQCPGPGLGRLSDTLNGTARTVGQGREYSERARGTDTYLLLSEVQYSYTPTYGYVVTGTLSLSDMMYMRPRGSRRRSRARLS